MSDRHYTGEIGTIVEVECGEDITAASVYNIRVRKPSGVEVTWSASIYGTTKLRHTVTSGDLDEDGTYYVQSYIEIGTWKGRGLTDSFVVYRHFANAA